MDTTGTTGFHELLGLQHRPGADGVAQVSFEAGDQHLNGGGSVHGGAIATLVDMAMGAAVANADDRDSAPVTIEMKVTYLEPGRPGELIAEACVRKRGRRITIVEAEVTQDEELVAHAIATFAT